MTTTANISGPSGTEELPLETQAASSSNSISPETAAVIVAVIVPVVVIAIVVVCFIQIQKHWKMRQAQSTSAMAVDASNERVGQSEDVQLYLQNKAELSVERAGNKMRPEGEIYELMGRDPCQEMLGEESRRPMLSLGERHELRGEDPARELDVCQDQRSFLQDPYRYSFDEPLFEDFNESVLSLHAFT